MSIDVVVAREPADKQGPDIVSGLLCITQAAIVRGTAAINDSTPVQAVTMRTTYRPRVRNGQVVQVLDELQGQAWVGKIVGISHTAQLTDVFSELRVEKLI